MIIQKWFAFYWVTLYIVFNLPLFLKLFFNCLDYKKHHPAAAADDDNDELGYRQCWFQIDKRDV